MDYGCLKTVQNILALLDFGGVGGALQNELEQLASETFTFFQIFCGQMKSYRMDQ